MPRRRFARRAFTLIELLIVVAIISLLMSILLPALGAARERARATKCLAHMRTFGQGLTIYVNEMRDVLVPGRLPKVDNCNAYALIAGGRKFRPTFMAMMSLAVNAPPFEDPKACRNEIDRFGEQGDMQNYSFSAYVCPSVPDWTDERNGSYGYNYQFLGNSRLMDDNILDSYKNWPVQITQIRHPSRTVAVADCMGTAASFAPAEREPYEDDSRDHERFGNEGFNLDPPRVDAANGEMAGFDDSPQCVSTVDPRHASGQANVMFVDSHAEARTVKSLGYKLNPDGTFAFDGDNSLWTTSGADVAWTPEYRP